jgi:hypothetical protein
LCGAAGDLTAPRRAHALTASNAATLLTRRRSALSIAH